jgi:hypothetical protein
VYINIDISYHVVLVLHDYIVCVGGLVFSEVCGGKWVGSLLQLQYDYKQLSRYSPNGTIEFNHFKVSSVDYVRSYSNYITLSSDGKAVRAARHFSFPQILLAGIINDNHF